MTVRDLIDRLRACDPDATVLLADWQEQYRGPSAEAASWPLDAGVGRDGPYVVIGNEPGGGLAGAAVREIEKMFQE